MSKLKTMDLKGNEYARVPTRLKAFREENPRGSVETTPQFLDDGQVLFKAHIVKDRSKPDSAQSTGHAIGKNTGNKAFEKLETIAVGRALALLGYLSSGEVASAEEMEDFYAYRDEKIEASVTLMENAESIEELKSIFTGLGNIMSEPKVIEAKDKRKKELGKDESS